MSPESVDDDLGEVRVVGGGDPVGKGFAEFFWREVGVDGLAKESVRFNDVTRFSVVVLIVVRETERFVSLVECGEFSEILEEAIVISADSFDFAPVFPPVFFSGVGRECPLLRECVLSEARDEVLSVLAFVLSGASKSGELIVLFLGPVIEWVIVTLGAADLVAEENLDGVADVIELHVAVA